MFLQFLQRSAKLRNSKFVVGLSVYTGKETKVLDLLDLQVYEALLYQCMRP